MENTKVAKVIELLKTLENDELELVKTSLDAMLINKFTTHDASEPGITASHDNKAQLVNAAPKLYEFIQQPGLDVSLITTVHQHLKSLYYRPSSNSPHSPEIFLYGNMKYPYNNLTASLKPEQILPNTTMGILLTEMNKKFGTGFNSILVNKYKNHFCKLGAHKDDESCLDPTSPIISLSFGATRRLQIYNNVDKKNHEHEITLPHGSVFVMSPGFQDNYHHGIGVGSSNEKGVRFSLTFRCLILKHCKSTTPILPKVVDLTPINNNHCLAPVPTITIAPPSPQVDSLVFGSSLVKNMNVELLSKHPSKFKVFCKPGGHVKDIYDSIKIATADKSIDPSHVKNIFLVCGGNDIENVRDDDELSSVFEDINDIVNLIRDSFTNVMINFISLIPRRARYKSHIKNMHKFNGWASSFCKTEKLNYINIFSSFLVKTPREWWLNDKLFMGDKVHFNKIGNSVLAKVLIGVANSPK